MFATTTCRNNSKDQSALTHLECRYGTQVTQCVKACAGASYAGRYSRLVYTLRLCLNIQTKTAVSDQGIDFRMRAHENYRVANGRGKPVPAWRLFATSGVDRMLVFPSPRRMWDLELYLSGCYLGKGEYLILVAPNYSEKPEEEFKKRWEIETLFGCLKTRGFNLEDTHLTEPERLSKLLALLAIAFCWAHKVGEWRARQEPLKIKKHGYLAKSTFRYGFDCLRRILTNLNHFDLVGWTRVIKLLSCT